MSGLQLIGAASLATIALFGALSCQSKVNMQSAVVTKAAESEHQTHLDVWSCQSHPCIRLVESGKCPICLAATVKTRLHLTYRQSTIYMCPEHVGRYASQGTCPECGKDTWPFLEEELVRETREVVRE